MALNFSGLSAYTQENIRPLLTSAVFNAKTQELVKSGGIIIPGVKSSVKIPLMDTDAVFQTDSCGFDASGTTTFSQRQISVGRIKLQEKICPKDLEAYFTQLALAAGSNYSDFGNAEFQEAYLAKKNARIAAQVETALWQGDTTSGTANLNKFDGFMKLIDAGSPVDANTSAFNGTAGAITTVNASNVVGATEGIFKALPTAVLGKGDAKIFVGDDWYRLLILAYRALNLFSYNPQDAAAKTFILPGTSVEVTAVNGLNGTGDAYGMALSNMAIGVDLEDDANNYQMIYNPYEHDVRFTAAFKIGCNVAFTNECVKFKAAI
jgi:hypothetical protein